MIILDINKDKLCNKKLVMRVNDKPKEKLIVQVLRDGQVDKWTGFSPTFYGLNAQDKKIMGTKVVRKTDYFEFTFPDNSFSAVGHFKRAYFELRDGDNILTTGDFEIEVINDIGIDKQEAEDIISLNDEIKKAIEDIKKEAVKQQTDLKNESIKQQKELKETAQKDANKALEITEEFEKMLKAIEEHSGETGNIAIANEVIKARGKYSNLNGRLDEENGRLDEEIEDLNGRLDEETGDLSSFRYFDTSLIKKIKNEASERGINVKWFGAKGDSKELDAKHIQKALDFGGKIIIPKGEYLIEKQLILKENTQLIMDKGAILYNQIHQNQPKGLKGISILSNYDVDTPVDGYNLPGNIYITGGILCGVKSEEEKNKLAPLGDIGQDGISISHGKNIVIRDVVVRNTFRGHGIEICGCSDVEVIDCVLDGCVLTSVDISAAREAIQLEHSGTNTSPSLQDKTVTKNITVRGCRITKTSNWANHWASGVGSHNNDNEKPMENIVISRNRIYDCTFCGIMVINYKNAKIEGNEIINCKRGIGFYSSRPQENVTFESNLLQNIEMNGLSIFEGSKKIRVINNIFMNMGPSSISAQDISDLTIEDNDFFNCGYDSDSNAVISLYGISKLQISKNSFSSDSDKKNKRCVYVSNSKTRKSDRVRAVDNNFHGSFTISDIYINPEAVDKNVVFSGTFPIVSGSKIKLDESIFKYSTLSLDFFFGAIITTLVPVSKTIRATILNVSKGANSMAIHEFTINVNADGNELEITLPRVSTITDSTQKTQDIPASLKMSVNKIIGNY